MEIRMKHDGTKKGIALLMSLSVILILSVALMKTFENRTVETLHMENTLQRFQVETLSRSVFRAILIAIKTKGLVFVNKNSSVWKGIPLPISEGHYFQIEEIKSVDPRFNLNLKFRAADLTRATILLNIINLHRMQKDELALDYIIDDIYPLLSALNDWVDVDINQDEEFLYNGEDYWDQQPEFNVKNREFDVLTEVRLIPEFRKLGFSASDLEDTFTVLAGSEQETIDVNLATPEEIEAFLYRYKDVEKYPNIFDVRSEIASIIVNRDAELNAGGVEPDMSESDARYTPPLYGRSSYWQMDLEAAGVELNQLEKGLFSSFTRNLYIRFSISTGKVTIRTDAYVRVNYVNPSKNLDIKGFTILAYEIH